MDLISSKFGSYYYKKSNFEDSDKRPIVYIHGFATNSLDYDSLFEEFEWKNDYYSIQLPGNGTEKYSGNIKDLSVDFLVDHCINLLKHLKLNNIILIGHSMGGQIAVKIANILESKLDRLILTCPNNSTLRFGSLFRYSWFCPKTFKKTLKFKSYIFKDITMHYDDLEKEIQNSYEFFKTNRKCFKQLRKKLFSPKNLFSCKTEENKLKAQTLIIAGKYDKLTSKNSIVIAFKRNYRPHIQIEVFEESGHVPFIEQKEKYVEVVQDFIA